MRLELEYLNLAQMYRITVEFISLRIPVSKAREIGRLPARKRPSTARKYVDDALASVDLDAEYHKSLTMLLLACVVLEEDNS